MFAKLISNFFVLCISSFFQKKKKKNRINKKKNKTKFFRLVKFSCKIFFIASWNLLIAR